ncbi:MAG: PEGA domain-containing protein [Polyangiaceae bacterium]
MSGCHERRRALASALVHCSVGLALLAHVDGAHAEPLADETASAEAATSNAIAPLIEQAAALLEAGNQHDALLVLQQAALLDPTSARVRVHLAATHQALGEWILAEQHLSFALAQRDDPYIAAHEEALSEALSAIEAQLSQLSVIGQPEGADVFLDGRRLGTLPLEAPARILSGPHVLRVSLRGHRAYTASLDALPGVPVNQVVYLEPEPRRVSPRRTPPPSDDFMRDEEPHPSSQWLTWTLGGLSGAAAVTSAAAFLVREQHAGRWNSVSCLEPGRTRAEVCAGERAQAQDWERVMIGSGIAAGALFAGALINWSLEPGHAERAAAISDCGLSSNLLYCRGRF